MTNQDGGYRLPSEIDPQRVQFCIEIPNELNHIIAFWGALEELTKWWNWERDDAHTALPVTAVWLDVIKHARASFEAGDCLSPELCQFYHPTSARVTWRPESPYNPLPEVPEGYNFHPWTIVTGDLLGTIIGEWGLGYKIGDVFTDLLHIPPFTFSPDLVNNLDNYPSFKISGMTGTGTVKIHFLNVFQGGRAVIRVDGDINPFNWQIAELHKDLTSIPQETVTPFVVEVEIDSDGSHEVDVTFLPTVDDSFIPVFFGGGFRGFELCGFGREGCEDVTDPCCPEELQVLGSMNSNIQKMLELLKSGFKIVPFESDLPSDFTIDCTPTGFDHNGDDETVPTLLQRNKALCLVVERYIVALLYFLGKRSNMSAQIKADILALMDLDAPPDFYPQLQMVDIEATLSQIGRIAYPTSTAFDEVVCAWVAGLLGKENTFENFKTSLVLLPDDSYPDNETRWLSHFVNAFCQNRANFTVFAKQLDGAYGEIVDGLTFECPCGLTECDPADLDIIATNDCTVTRVDDTHWHVVQTNYTAYLADKRQFHLAIRDSAWRCFNVVSQTQATAGYNQYDCDGTNFTGVGGGGGVVVQMDETVLEYNTDPVVGIDTILEIICP